MFTDEERFQRATTVVNDAFGGQPVMWTQDENEKTLRRGEVLDTSDWRNATVLVTIEILVNRSSLVLTERVSDITYSDIIYTYQEMAIWAYTLSRKYKIQDWVTPRHFVCLVNEILEPDPPLAYKETWPHEHRVSLPGGVKFDFEWDDEECRIVTVVPGKGGVGIKSPEDAIGWLSALKQECGLCQSP